MSPYEIFNEGIRFLDIILIPGALWLYRFLSRWRLENRKRDEEKKKNQELIMRAIRVMLKDKLMQSGEFFINLGAIPSSIKSRLLEAGECYIGLDGNGDGKTMYEGIKHLPVDDMILKKAKEAENNAVRKG